MEQHIEQRSEISPLWRAIDNNRKPDITLVKSQLENGHDPNETWSIPGLRTQLHSGGCVLPSFSNDDMLLRVSPLLTAVTSDQPEVAELLLQFGAKTETRTRSGTTALHEVIKLRREDLARLLIDHGADVEAGVQQKDFEGCTSLHFAAGTSDLKMAELLLDRRANLTAASTHGWTPLDVALLDRQVTMAHYLIGRSPPTVFPFARRFENQPSSRESTVEEANEPRELALHLLEKGIENADSRHRALYLGCLSNAYRQVDFVRGASIELVRSLVDELESKLMSIAEYADKISTNRTLCQQCDKFQSQDALTIFRPFLHSQSFSSLLLSASGGCHLCELLVDALNRLNDSNQGRRPNIGIVNIDEGSQVILQIALDVGPGIWVGCDGKTSKIDLKHLDSAYNCLALQRHGLA
jgi:hypothetical protein